MSGSEPVLRVSGVQQADVWPRARLPLQTRLRLWIRIKRRSRIDAKAMTTPFAPDDHALREQAQQLGERLRSRHESLVTAESCTGGWIAKVATDISGSSDWFDCGIVAYSYEAKQALLRVRPQTLEEHGAVSRETVLEMVAGALVNSGAAIAVAVTGIAGPGGGSEGKPVGTVWIGWKRRGQYARAELFQFEGDRDAVRRQTVAAAMQGLDGLLQ